MTLSQSTKDRLDYAMGPWGRAASDEINQLLGYAAGTTYYVQSTSAAASDTSGRLGTSRDEPFATLDYAIGRTTASKGDTIVLLPGHAETTTAIALDVIGIRIIGLGYGRNRPTLTATTAASDLLSVTAANCEIHNVRFVGAASGCTALLNIEAADFRATRCSFEHGAAPLSAVTVVAASHRFVLEDCDWRGTAAGPDYCINIEAGAGLTCNDWRVIRPYAAYGVSAGLDNAFLQLNVPGSGYAILDAVILGFDTLAIDINSSTLAVGDGIMSGYAAASGAITFANAIDAGGCLPMEFLISDDPATRGKEWPTATPT